MRTLFIRTSSASFEGYADVAHVALVAADNPTGPTVAYLGEVSGHYAASEIEGETHSVCFSNGEDVWAWVASKGYARKPDTGP